MKKKIKHKFRELHRHGIWETQSTPSATPCHLRPRLSRKICRVWLWLHQWSNTLIYHLTNKDLSTALQIRRLTTPMPTPNGLRKRAQWPMTNPFNFPKISPCQCRRFTRRDAKFRAPTQESAVFGRPFSSPTSRLITWPCNRHLRSH